MTEQMWTIWDLGTGEVLHPCWITESTGVHPKDRGLDGWDSAAMRATKIDARPDVTCEYFAGGVWVKSLPILRARKWSAVKAQAAVAESWGCETASGRVQTDADSRGKITGMVVMAMLAQSFGQPFSQPFTMADNSSVMVDVAGMIAIGLAAGAHVVACHAIAQDKRTEIDAAENEAAIAAVDVDNGWPDAPAG